MHRFNKSLLLLMLMMNLLRAQVPVSETQVWIYSARASCDPIVAGDEIQVFEQGRLIGRQVFAGQYTLCLAVKREGLNASLQFQKFHKNR